MEAKDKPLDEVVNAYLYGVLDSKNGQLLTKGIQDCFDKVKTLLNEKSGLLTDFTETYRRVHGMVKNNIHEFISMGQTSGSESAQSG
jgi:hypothetical protein